MTTLSPEFQKAVEDSRKLEKKPSHDELLELYALYKQGTQDPAFAAAPEPTMFDLKGKAKYAAWKKVSEIPAEEAQTKYVALVEELKVKHGYDANKVPEPVGGS